MTFKTCRVASSVHFTTLHGAQWNAFRGSGLPHTHSYVASLRGVGLRAQVQVNPEAN